MEVCLNKSTEVDVSFQLRITTSPVSAQGNVHLTGGKLNRGTKLKLMLSSPSLLPFLPFLPSSSLHSSPISFPSYLLPFSPPLPPLLLLSLLLPLLPPPRSSSLSSSFSLSTANTDYLPLSQVVTCEPGGGEMCVSITILNDTTLEATESFRITAELVTMETDNVSRLTVAPRETKVCIIDDDSEIFH